MAVMNMTGRNVVVGSMRSRFPASHYFPVKVLVQGEITTWSPEAGNGILRVRVLEATHATLTAALHVGLSLHEPRATATAEQRLPAIKDSGMPLSPLTAAGRSVRPAWPPRLSATQ